MSNNDHDVSVLNTLIKTTIDSVNGYRDAAEDTQAGRFAAMFRECAGEREQIVSQLQARVRSLGGDPNDSASALGSAHQAFMGLKDKLMGHDEKAVIDEVERGEDYIKEKYETALADDRLSQETRTVIQQAFTSIRSGHDRVSSLKHGMEASR